MGCSNVVLAKGEGGTSRERGVWPRASVSRPCPSSQVAMGYAHSLVIARDETDAEKEKLRKLPEYNPRTI